MKSHSASLKAPRERPHEPGQCSLGLRWKEGFPGEAGVLSVGGRAAPRGPARPLGLRHPELRKALPFVPSLRTFTWRFPEHCLHRIVPVLQQTLGCGQAQADHFSFKDQNCGQPASDLVVALDGP